MSDYDYDALVAAVDGGDDSALPALADWLEERGDPRAAAGVRAMIGRRRPYLSAHAGWGWKRHGETGNAVVRGAVTSREFAIVTAVRPSSTPAVCYPTRSAAYLALAAAIAGSATEG